MKITTATILLFTLLCVPATGANLVTFQITATVDEVVDPLNVLDGSVVLGDLLTGILQYDLDLADVDKEADRGQYGSSSFGDNFIEGTNGASGNFSTTNLLRVTTTNNAPMLGTDSVNFLARGDTTPSALVHPAMNSVDLSIALRDTDGTVFTDASLPAVLNLSNFEEATLSLLAYGQNPRGGLVQAFSVGAIITSITQVPEPSTLLLGALASVGLLARRRGRKM